MKMKMMMIMIKMINNR